MTTPTPIRPRPGQIAAVQRLGAEAAPPAANPAAAQLTEITTARARDAMTRAAVVISLTHQRPIRSSDAKAIERYGLAALDLAILDLCTDEGAYPLPLRTLAIAVYRNRDTRKRIADAIATMARGYVGTDANPAAAALRAAGDGPDRTDTPGGTFVPPK